MSKNEFLEVLNQFMDSVATKDDLCRTNVNAWSEDDVRDLIHEEMVAVGVGPCFEDDVVKLVDETVSDAIADEVRNWDYVESSDLDDYPTWDDLDDRIESVAVDHLNLVDRDEVESIVGDFIDEHDFSDAVDDVVNCYDWEYVLENADPNWDYLLRDTRLNERVKALELKLAMYEILDTLDSVRR